MDSLQMGRGPKHGGGRGRRPNKNQDAACHVPTLPKERGH